MRRPPAFVAAQPLPLRRGPRPAAGSPRIRRPRPASARARAALGPRLPPQPPPPPPPPPPRQSVVVGLTQYSHDASVAVVDAGTGVLLFALSKERLTRRKHDGGGVAALLRHALRELRLPLSAVKLVVANNHHHRVADFEARLAFGVAAGFYPPEYASRYNLTPGVAKLELSHHLAHAWSALRGARGLREGRKVLVLVMDGMGDARGAWVRREVDAGRLYCDEELPVVDGFREWPARDVLEDGHSGVAYREAESAYLAVCGKGGGVELRRVFKRWTREVSPPELYNHGFHDMESVGAVYSRVATRLFGDWNACGKVMGLAPCAAEGGAGGVERLMSGRLFDGSFRVHVGAGEGEGGGGGNLDAGLAARVQADLEVVTLALLEDLRAVVGEDVHELVFAGGVALNSTLNGRIVRESGFERLYVPPCPGDEGVAIGCALYGFEHAGRIGKDLGISEVSAITGGGCGVAMPFPSYLGTSYSALQIFSEVERFASWTESEMLPTFEALASAVVELLAEGEVVAWFNGGAEFGPRALGNRSLLADPRRADMVDRLNLVVKRRESFRPFAPSCLAPHVPELFGRDCHSLYMTITMPLLDPARTPAVAHVDGTARLQTLDREDNPNYYDLIDAFYAATGVPAVLNTSFNVAGEPIVHSPADALRALLSADGIAAVAFPAANTLVRVRDSPPDAGEGCEEPEIALACGDFRSEVVRSATGHELRVSVLFDEYSDDLADDEADTADDEVLEELRLPRRVELDSAEDLEVLELIAASDGAVTLLSLCAELENKSEFDAEGEDKDEDDLLEDVRCMVTSLWRKRLITVGAYDE